MMFFPVPRSRIDFFFHLGDQQKKQPESEGQKPCRERDRPKGEANRLTIWFSLAGAMHCPEAGKAWKQVEHEREGARNENG
jgi:hypothetical protein